VPGKGDHNPENLSIFPFVELPLFLTFPRRLFARSLPSSPRGDRALSAPSGGEVILFGEVRLGTGLNLADLEVKKAREAEVRRRLDELMGLDPNLRSFTSYYVTKDRYEDVAANDPETMALMGLSAQLERQRRARAQALQAAGE
jgi:hypothetical protein